MLHIKGVRGMPENMKNIRAIMFESSWFFIEIRALFPK